MTTLELDIIDHNGSTGNNCGQVMNTVIEMDNGFARIYPLRLESRVNGGSYAGTQYIKLNYFDQYLLNVCNKLSGFTHACIAQ